MYNESHASRLLDVSRGVSMRSHLSNVNLWSQVKEEPFSVLIDESLNKPVIKKQLNVDVRFWKDSKVQTRYLESVVLGHA